jgi:hypothetical protein
MASYLFADRVRERATHFDNVVTLLGATPACQTFASGLGANGTTCICAIRGADWLVAEAQYTLSTNRLTLGTTLDESTVGSPWLADGEFDVFITVPGSRIATVGTNTFGDLQTISANVAPLLSLHRNGGANIGIQFRNSSGISKHFGVDTAGRLAFGSNADLTSGSTVWHDGLMTTGNGIVARTATGAFAPRTISGTTGEITVSNGDGVAGNPVMSLATSGVTAGTYNRVTVDTKGRVTSASTVAYLTGNQSITVTGDATGTGTTAIALTLANSGVVAGTYQKVTVDAKGRVTAGASMTASDVTTALGATAVSNATNATKLTTARTIALSGDATGSVTFDGSANATIAATLAASGATAGTYTKVTVDAKGRVTAGASLTATDVTTALGFVPNDADNVALLNAANTFTAPISIASTLSVTSNLYTSGSISSTASGDAVLQLETTGYANTNFRRFQTIISPNVPDAILFRLVRPSDSAIRDFTLSGGGGGIWHTGNLNPAIYFNAAAARDQFAGTNMGAGYDFRNAWLEVVGQTVRIVRYFVYRTAPDSGGGE